MTDIYLARPQTAKSLRPVDGIDEPLFLHASGAQVKTVAPLCAAGHLGAIYTVSGGASRDNAVRKIAQAHRSAAGEGATFLIDAARYDGRDREPADAELSLSWLREQWDHGATWAMTDSGYIHRDRVDQLDAVFAEGALLRSQAPVGAKLLLAVAGDYQWVSHRADDLRKRVDQYELPVVYMFGAEGDPLETHAAVAGLLHLLDSPVPSALARSDHAALGALAGRAVFGAMGTSTRRRHIYPPKKGGGRSAGEFSVLLPEGLSFHRNDTLARAIALSPDESYWHCHHCELCDGRRLDEIFDPTTAFVHSIESLQETARRILSSGDQATAMKSWKAKCADAQFIHSDIEATGIKWTYPMSLTAWVSAP